MKFSCISAVIPVHNEAGNLKRLHEELVQVLSTCSSEYEIIYVNDASTDGSLAELQTLKDCTIINLRRKYGQATALDAGFKAAKGDLIVSLDGDGQNDPADIPKLLRELEDKNFDVVTGWRKQRADNHGIRVLTRIGRAFRRFLIQDPAHDTGCTLRVYRAEAIKSLELGGEMHRYILALLRWKGFTVGEVVVRDRPRLHGKSKYGYGKAVRGLIDLIYIWFIYKYSQRPLHLFGYMSFAALAAGAISLVLTIYDRTVLGIHLNDDGWFYITFFLLIAAIMLFSFGIIIDLLLRIYLSTSSVQKPYYVKDIQKI